MCNSPKVGGLQWKLGPEVKTVLQIWKFEEQIRIWPNMRMLVPNSSQASQLAAGPRNGKSLWTCRILFVLCAKNILPHQYGNKSLRLKQIIDLEEYHQNRLVGCRWPQHVDLDQNSVKQLNPHHFLCLKEIRCLWGPGLQASRLWDRIAFANEERTVDETTNELYCKWTMVNCWKNCWWTHLADGFTNELYWSCQPPNPHSPTKSMQIRSAPHFWINDLPSKLVEPQANK
jgi:hypothetical protein